MEYKFAFEKLDVWERSRQLASRIYKLTKAFPEDEKYGLVSQLRRASISICSNLAEGNSRKSYKDRANFFQMAFSSTMEVLCQLVISNDLGFLPGDELVELRSDIYEISNKTNALYKRQLQTTKNTLKLDN